MYECIGGKIFVELYAAFVCFSVLLAKAQRREVLFFALSLSKQKIKLRAYTGLPINFFPFFIGVI